MHGSLSLAGYIGVFVSEYVGAINVIYDKFLMSSNTLIGKSLLCSFYFSPKSSIPLFFNIIFWIIVYILYKILPYIYNCCQSLPFKMFCSTYGQCIITHTWSRISLSELSPWLQRKIPFAFLLRMNMEFLSWRSG